MSSSLRMPGGHGAVDRRASRRQRRHSPVTGDTRAPTPRLAPPGLTMMTRDDIHRAYDAIRPYVRRTPVIALDLAGPVTLKLEQLQCAGSFKARGAFTNLLLRDVPSAGVVAAS